MTWMNCTASACVWSLRNDVPDRAFHLHCARVMLAECAQ
jgi:hypothetical protein